MKNENKLDRIIWLFEKQEKLRYHNANRASTLVTANSIIIAANIFIIGRFWSSLYNFSYNVSNWYLGLILINLPILISFGFSVLSIFYSLNSFVRYKKTSNEILPDIDERLFVHSRDTVNKITDFEHFKYSLSQLNDKNFEKYLTADYWTVTNLHELGYQKLRVGTKYFVWSLYFLFFNIFISTLMTYLRGIL